MPSGLHGGSVKLPLSVAHGSMSVQSCLDLGLYPQVLFHQHHAEKSKEAVHHQVLQATGHPAVADGQPPARHSDSTASSTSFVAWLP